MEPSASGSSSWTPQHPVVDMHKQTQCPSWLSVQLRPTVPWSSVFRLQYQQTAVMKQSMLLSWGDSHQVYYMA